MQNQTPQQQFAIKKLLRHIQSVKRTLAADRITIDFETRCELSLKGNKSVGPYKYSQHPSCKALMMSYSLTGRPEDTRIWCDGDKPPYALFSLLANSYKLNAFNSYFEYCIWTNYCVPKLGWPPIAIEDLLDTQNKCKALALPASLDEAATVLQVDHVKNPEGEKLIELFSRPKTKDGKVYFNDRHSHPEEWERFKNYAIEDTKATIAIDDILPDLSPFEQAVAFMTDRINWRGVYVDIVAVHAAEKLAEQVKVRCNKEAAALSGGVFERCTQREKVRAWLADCDLVLPNMRSDTIDVALRRDDLAPKVRRMLELYKMAGSSSTAKFKAMQRYVADDGRIHELLNYHRARTGRYGAVGVQIQNLPRPVLPKWVDYDDVIAVIKRDSITALEAFAKTVEAEDKRRALANGKDKWWTANMMQVLVSAIRSVLTPMVGDHFKSADYSAIEARTLLWLAGDKRGLDIFRRGEDIYLDMAATIYGVPLDSLTKDSDERALGKETILGAGYQMWADTFKKRCNEVAGIQLTYGEATKAILAYRRRYSRVELLWDRLQKAAIAAVLSPGNVVRYGVIQFKMAKYGKMPILLCRAPSGHTTGYPYPRVKNGNLYHWGVDSYTRKWAELNTYGGKLTENVTQKVARDLLVFGMLLLHVADYTLVMSVHDEVVSEDCENFGSLQEFETLLCTLPKWAEGLPVTSEGWIGMRYRK